MKLNRSLLMSDCSQNDEGKEAVMSFVISWVLRMTTNKESIQKRPILNLKCRAFLFKLLGIDSCYDYEISSVKVWKEKKNIDVWAEVILLRNNELEKHVIAIENKVYKTEISPNQLYEYPPKVHDYYTSKGEWQECKYHFCVISCLDEYSKLSKLTSFCEKSEWKVFGFYDLVDLNPDKLTESDIFNEFWLSDWTPIPEGKS